MPFRLLKSKTQFKLMQANVGAPIAVAAIGLLLTFFVGLNFQKNVLKDRVAALNVASINYSKQIELNMLNSTLRIQSMLETYGFAQSRMIAQHRVIEEILSHTNFERVTFLKTNKKKDATDWPIIQSVYNILVEKDSMPQFTSATLNSKSVKDKIRSMGHNRKPSAFMVVTVDGMQLCFLIWQSFPNSSEYFLFSTPLAALFPNFDLRNSLTAVVTEEDIGNRTIVGRLSDVGGETLEPGERSGGAEVKITGNGSDSSSFNISWIGKPDRSISRLAWSIWIGGSIISALISLFLRFILSQNRKVADLVVQRTIDLEAALDDATEANLAKSRFLANVSHELRTPLNIILGMIELMEEKVHDSKIQEFLKAMRVSSDQLLTQISDLLAATRKDSSSDSMAIKNVPIKCSKFLEEVVKILKPDFERNGLELKFGIAPDVPTHFRGDPARIRQVLMNLLRNAIKYTRQGFVEFKVSLLRAQSESGQVTLRFAIKDTGVGIPKDKKKQIFDRFLQLESTRVLSQGGVGLGLSIVKDLVEMMNGSILVDSEVGVGSTFLVDLTLDAINSESWLEEFVKAQRKILKIAIITTDRGLIEDLQNYLSGLKVEFVCFSVEEFKSFDGKSNDHHFTHILIDHKAGVKREEILSQKIDAQILVLGNENESEAVKDQNLRGYPRIESRPVLPTELLEALGVRPTEIKAQTGVVVPAKQLPIADRIPKLSVLIADDDRGNRDLFEAYFAEFGWKLDFTENGQEALDLYRRSPHDVVIADLRMPIMDGLEMTDRVRAFETAKNLKSVPIILVTADALDETEESARKHGVTIFLTKPIRKANIINTILNVTSGS